MATLILLRHGRTTANASGVLAGWMPDVHLDDLGREQAKIAAQEITRATSPVLLASSPLVRCQETVAPLARSLELDVTTEDELGECRYGAWTGQSLADLARDPLWTSVQNTPSRVTFPASYDYEHESMSGMQARAVAAIRRLDAGVEGEHGTAATWVAVSHGDVIKAVLADALHVPLDDFQRIVASPASISVIRYTSTRPYVLTMNHTGEGLSGLLASAATSGSDATVGGSSGTSAARR